MIPSSSYRLTNIASLDVLSLLAGQKLRNENIGSSAPSPGAAQVCSGNRGGFIAICFVRENHQYRVEHDLQVRKGSRTDLPLTSLTANMEISGQTHIHIGIGNFRLAGDLEITTSKSK